MNQDPSARLRLETHALRHVLALPVEDRADAAERLNGCALALVATVGAVFRQLAETPNIDPADVAQMLDQRPALRADVEALDAAGLSSWASRPLDPTDARAAFDACLADAATTGTARRIEAAERLLADAKTAPTEQARRDMLADAARVLERPALVDARTLGDDWAAFMESQNANPFTPLEAVQLDARRGPWASWFNAHLGDRGGLEPGTNVFIGGSWGAGKTSLGALLAVDAMIAGCPVLFWQLELSRFKTLEHLVAQRLGMGAWWRKDYRTRAASLAAGPPDKWADLLDIPRHADPEAAVIQAAIERLARRTKRARQANPDTWPHACYGLVVVDYIQKLAKREKGARAAEHEILNSAVSDLVKTAADLGVCLVLLSQINKDAQKLGDDGGTALAGADLARAADVLVTVRKAKRKDGGEWVAAQDADKVDPVSEVGEPRLLTFHKTRGIMGNPDGGPKRQIWTWNRALHDGTLFKTAEREGL